MQSHIEVQPDGEIEIDEKVVKCALIISAGQSPTRYCVKCPYIIIVHHYSKYK
jgi:hypothetical protein